MKKIFKITAALILSLSATSCEDFLELEPEGAITVDIAYSSPDRLEKALADGYYYIYQTMCKNDLTLFRFLSTDLGRSGSEAGVAQSQGYADYTFTYSSWSLTSYWERSYQGIEKMNVILDYIPKNNWDDEIQRNKVEGTARFFRAFFNFGLVQRFGNIILNTAPNYTVTIPTSTADPDDVYANIISDLDRAIDILEAAPATPVDRCLVNRDAAKYLRAKVALVRGDYETAATLTEEMIASGKYELCAEPEAAFDYTLLKENKEAVFIMSFYRLDSSNSFSHNVASICHPISMDIAPTTVELGKKGKGWVKPTNYLLDLYAKNSGFDMIKDGTYVDKRYVDYFFTHEQWLANLKSGVSVDNVTDEQAYTCCRKHWDEIGGSDGQTGTFNGYESFALFRYAEVLLIASEANALKETPDQVKAKEYINEVRRRAMRRSADGLFEEADYVNIDITEDITIDHILDERARELCFEFHRWEDLKRTGKLLEYLERNEEIAGRIEQKHLLMPIPYRQLMYGNYLIDQNPGW